MYQHFHIVCYEYIEGNPFIIRFKTLQSLGRSEDFVDIEGNPFIIRFKTLKISFELKFLLSYIEGNPFIIRFKTSCMLNL